MPQLCAHALLALAATEAGCGSRAVQCLPALPALGCRLLSLVLKLCDGCCSRHSGCPLLPFQGG